jgi:hypothetical protein
MSSASTPSRPLTTDQYGFDIITTHQPILEPLGQVIAAYRATTS